MRRVAIACNRNACILPCGTFSFCTKGVPTMMANRKLRTGILLGAGILMISAHLPMTISEAAARSVSTYFVPTDVDADSSRLLAAAEPFEALTEMAYSALGLHLERGIA